jgi:hypothetical protein
VPYLSAMADEQTERARGLAIRDAVATYHYLRVGMVALVILLLVSTLITGLFERCALPSISAYFYTTTHAVFVSALCAVGSCLIIYHGRTQTEDLLLNFSGILAFVVALVPTPKPDNTCGGGLPTRDNPDVGVVNNIVALVIAALAGVGLYLLFKRLGDRKLVAATHEHVPQVAEPQRIPGRLLKILKVFANVLVWVERKLGWIMIAILVAGCVVFLCDGTLFNRYAHMAAAILMFAGIIGVSVLYACYSAGESDQMTKRRFFTSAYLVIAGLMAGLVVAAAVWACLGWDHWTLAAEVLLIFGFALFWLVQTYDTWDIHRSTYSKESLTKLAERKS